MLISSSNNSVIAIVLCAIFPMFGVLVTLSSAHSSSRRDSASVRRGSCNQMLS